MDETEIINFEDGIAVEVDIPQNYQPESDVSWEIISGLPTRSIKKTFKEAFSKVSKPLLSSILSEIDEMWDRTPDKSQLASAEIEVGFAFTTEGSLKIVKLGASTQIKVTFSFSNPTKNS